MERDFANELPTSREPNNPGPCVYAIAVNSFLSIFASFNACETTGMILD